MYFSRGKLKKALSLLKKLYLENPDFIAALQEYGRMIALSGQS